MSWDPCFTLKIIQKCAENIAEHRKNNTWELKNDDSLVTPIDKANERFLRENLVKNGEYFLGEESIDEITPEYLENALEGPTYIVDPIDGTAPFAHGLPLWAISVGYMEKGFLTDGCIMMPDLNEAYISCGEDVLFTGDIMVPLDKWQKLPKRNDAWSIGAMLITGQEYTKKHLIPVKNPILVPGSAVQSFSTLLSGKVIAYIGHMKLWDVAGSIPLLRRMGFICRLTNGIIFDGHVRCGAFDFSAGPGKMWRFTSDIITALPHIHPEIEKLLDYN